VADRHAVEQLLHRYALGNDEHDIDAIAATMTEDVSVTIVVTGGDTYGPFEGREDAMAFFKAALDAEDDIRKHVISNVLVNGSSAIAYLTLIVTDGGKTELKSAGRYDAELAGDGDDVRIARMTLTMDAGW
jgi:ketosteroid isomerase-like protein